MIRVENLEIVRREVRLIRPPRQEFEFTYLHGISWDKVAGEPVFGAVWPQMLGLLDGAEFIAAHHASFDEGVLRACVRSARLPMPTLPFQCTVTLARKTWNIFPTKLPNVCRHLGIPLKHHDAASDAEACAQIVIAACRGK